MFIQRIRYFDGILTRRVGHVILCTSVIEHILLGPIIQNKRDALWIVKFTRCTRRHRGAS